MPCVAVPEPKGSWCTAESEHTHSWPVAFQLGADVLLKNVPAVQSLSLFPHASPGFRNNTFRAAQLEGNISSPNAKALFPPDRLPTVLERGKVFKMPKFDYRLCPGTMPS